MTDKTYTVTLTEAHMRVISTATEVLARLGIGQIKDAIDWLPLRSPFADGLHEDCRAIESILSKYNKMGVNGYNSSLGIANSETSESAKIAWEIYQTFRHRLSWEIAIEEGIISDLNSPRDWTKMMGVNFDEPMKITYAPLPLIDVGHGATFQACNELTAALGWPNGISAGPMTWAELLAYVAQKRVQMMGDK